MYITRAKFKQIVRELEVPMDFKFEDIVLWVLPNGTEVKGDKESSKTSLFAAMFSQRERNQLLLFKALCKGETGYITHIYHKIGKPVDSLKYIQAERRPVFHSDPNCPAMKSDYEMISIPEQIIKQGKDKVYEYRKYWYKHSDLRESDMVSFLTLLNHDFSSEVPICEHDFEVTTLPNSGAQAIEENRSVSEINDDIVRQWEELVTWLKEKRVRLANLLYYGDLSWLGTSDTPIGRRIRIGTETELKEQLAHIHPYKQQIKRLLQELYIRTYIPELDFDDSLLVSLGFEPCYICTTNELEHHHEV